MISVIVPSLKDSKELNEAILVSLDETKTGQVEFILEESNSPFAVNVNNGIKKSTGDIILVLNNDVIMLPGWYEWVEKMTKYGVVALSASPQMGWGFGISKGNLEKIGYFDENLVNSYDDYDFFIRAAREGIQRILAPRNFAIHQGGQSLKRVWGEFSKQTPERISQCKANRSVMLSKWPGLQIDGVPTLYWAHHGISIMKEWSKNHVQESIR